MVDFEVQYWLGQIYVKLVRARDQVCQKKGAPGPFPSLH